MMLRAKLLTSEVYQPKRGVHLLELGQVFDGRVALLAKYH